MADRGIEDIVSAMLVESARAASGRTDQALDISYWRTLSPGLGIEGTASPERHRVTSVDVPALVRQVSNEGYFCVPSVFDPAAIEQMRLAVERLRSDGWHPAFAFVYDEFWSICHAAPLVGILTALLGPGFRQTAKTWCHYVASVDGARGWAPHVDGQPGRERLTIWIPLSDATVGNGCMAVVPKGRVARYLVEDWDGWNGATRHDVEMLLQHVRPLPAPAGSVLGWEMGVVHWGMVAHQSVSPRVSVSFDFVSATQAASPNELPALPADTLPSFRERLTFIAQNVLDYERFEPELGRYRDLATRLAGAR